MKKSEVLEETGISAATLKRYVEKGLIQAPDGEGEFDDNTSEIVIKIKELTSNGNTLAEVGELFSEEKGQVVDLEDDDDDDEDDDGEDCEVCGDAIPEVEEGDEVVFDIEDTDDHIGVLYAICKKLAQHISHIGKSAGEQGMPMVGHVVDETSKIEEICNLFEGDQIKVFDCSLDEVKKLAVELKTQLEDDED